MSESEITFDPNPLHREPTIIDRHETDAEVQRRGHIMPNEWDHKFDPNNQPITPPYPAAQNLDFQRNVMESNPNRPSINDPSKA
jgi:hypothetical protein